MYSVAQTSPNTTTSYSMYYLQVKPNNIQGNSTTQSSKPSMHMLVKSLEHENQHFLVPMVQTSQPDSQGQLQFFVDPCEEVHTLVDCIDIQKHTEAVPNIYPPQINKKLPNSICPPVSIVKSQNTDQLSMKTENNWKALVNSTSFNSITPGILNGVNPKDIEEIALKQKKEKKLHSNYVHISDRQVPPRAVAVLPAALQIRREVVSPRRTLSMHVRFGPIRGVSRNISHMESSELVRKASSLKNPIFLLGRDDHSVTHIDMSDKDKSNWLSLLPLGDQSTANVWLYEEDEELYGVTNQSLSYRTPLALGYSKEYALMHQLPEGQPVMDLKEAEESSVQPQKWWCYECNRVMTSAALLQRHIDVYHKDEKSSARRKYRCRHCSRTFSRLFTLKRHVTRHCTKRTEVLDGIDGENTSKTEHLPDVSLNTTEPSEEARIPSDESFHNFTNSLDFTTNLFDTDRMPNLDLTGSSKSDEFNPYNVGFKDDNTLHDLVFKPSNGSDAFSYQNENHAKVEPTTVSCTYCKQLVEKRKKRQHLRLCPKRRFECECGRVFTNKDSLALHIYTEHPAEPTSKTVNVAPEPSPETVYTCEECKLKDSLSTFKRRGMLVNHLWRVHRQVSAAEPLQRRVRHYPCAVCPKLYRAADKRDRHMRVHHPEAELTRVQAIEGGSRTCPPAVCPACPRQYVTRAKLLQHIRSHHPHLAPPVKTKTPLKPKSNENNQLFEDHPGGQLQLSKSLLY